MELITKSFESQCLAFPERVDQVLAKVETVEEAKDYLDKAVAMQHYAERLKAGVEISKPIALGVLKIKAKLGELMPAKPPGERGQGRNGSDKSTTSSVVDFHPSVISAYRKLAKHRDRLEDYCQNAEDIPTQGEFLRLLKQENKQSKRQNGQQSAKRDGCKLSDLHEHAESGAKYDCIYADPPWSYDNKGTRATADDHYSTMSVEDIAALPVESLAADSSLLFLWTTNAFIESALTTIIPAWGFEFKSSVVWVKPQIGIGNYVRCSHEFLLIGSRGGRTGASKNQISWIEHKRTKHSSKPHVFREVAERVTGPGNYLELFGREHRPGWSVWGNEISRQQFLEVA